MKMRLSVLQRGECEPLKAAVHAAALGLAAVMGAYNGAAWLSRRDHKSHLAVNTVLYAVLTVWERRHVAHHLAELKRCRSARAATPADRTRSADITLAA